MFNSNSNYPPGAANDPRAPYNQVDNDEIKIRVGIDIHLYKEFELYTSNYDIDEDGTPILDNNTLRDLVDSEIFLPHEAYLFVDSNRPRAKRDLNGWNLVDMEVEEV